MTAVATEVLAGCDGRALAQEGDGPPNISVVFSGSSTTLGKGGVDEELSIQGSRVVWTAGGVLRKQLSTTAPVLKAAWCFFQNTGPDAILCLLHPGVLSVFTQDGDSHTIPLPGHFSGLWPLPQGVLLTGAAAQGPCILVHPLENIQEVQLQAAAAAPHADDWDMVEQVVWSSVEVPYLVTHNMRHTRLALWSTQRAQGFVAVTPMRWPGCNSAPRTPGAQVSGGRGALAAAALTGSVAHLTTPVAPATGGTLAAPAGTYKK